VTWLRNRWLHRGLGIVLGGLFLYAAAAKVVDPRPLITIIWGYRIVPPGPTNLMAIYMPWLELLVGLGLLTGFKRHAAALWATGLLSVFVLALLINALRGINVACGCFSTSAEDVQNAWLLVLRDLPMLLAALVMLFFPPHASATAVQLRGRAGQARRS
jgi:putative oxidoreductase